MADGGIVLAKLKTGAFSCRLRVACEAGVQGLEVSRAVLESGVLTTWHGITLEETLHETKAHRIRLIPPGENPFLSDAEKAALDEAGLIRPESTTRANEALASLVKVHVPGVGIKTPPVEGFERISDEALRCPSDWRGAVVSTAGMTEDGRGITVILEMFRPVCVGDIVLLDNVPFTIGGVFDGGTDSAEMRMGAGMGSKVFLAAGQTREFEVSVGEESGRSATCARAMGPCSLITLMPLGGRSRRRAQTLTAGHVHTLREAGMRKNLEELLTLKSSDAGNRKAVRAALEGNGVYPDSGAPFHLHVMAAELAALGLRASFTATGDHLEMSLSLMSDADRQTLSSGRVSKPETINYRTYLPEKDGLFCEKVFGPESGPRHLRFGHIELVEPIVPYIWLMPGPGDSPSLLAGLLNMSNEGISKLLEENYFLTMESGQPELHATEAEAQVKFPGAQTFIGSGAIAALLRLARDGNSQLPEMSEFILARTILVLPPDIRPLVLLDDGNFATSDLNDHYRRIINRANRLWKLMDLNAPPVIIQNERRMLQRHASDFVGNEYMLRPVLGSNNRPLVSLMRLFTARFEASLIRCNFSASGRAVPTSAECVGIPQAVMDTLKLGDGDSVLVTRAELPSDCGVPMMALRAEARGDFAMAIPAAAYQHLFAGVDGSHECIVHRPLTQAAREEAAANVARPLAATRPWKEDDWYSHQPKKMIAKLLAAAIGGNAVSLASPRSLLFAGPGVPAITPVTDDSYVGVKTVDIPARQNSAE